MFNESVQNHAPNSAPVERQKPKKRLFWKILLTVLLTSFVFAAGDAVGRGSLHVRWLSRQPTSSNLTTELDYTSVDKIYDLLKQDFDGQLNKEQLLDGIKSGLVGATGDPYTEYFNAKDAKAFNEALSGSFSGIGAELGTDADNNIVVVSPLSGYPAEKAGLKPHDVIAAIDGQPTTGISVNTAVRKIKGPAGSKVTLTIVRSGGIPFDVSITRSQINVPSVKSQIDGNIGYLKINQFSSDTADLARQAVDGFKSRGVKGVVLDLRGDPGGYLKSAVDISSMWLDKDSTVVQERTEGKVKDTLFASGNNPLNGIPTIVLIDDGSASASEITAGALHDNKIATLVGVKSFGKGSVQQVIDLPGGSEVKITTAHWYTPNGKNINKQGIVPDIVITNSDSDVKAGKDPQKDKAYEIMRTKIGS